VLERIIKPNVVLEKKRVVMRNCLGLVGLLVVLSSCSWMMEAKTPEFDRPSKFNSQLESYQEIESLPYLAWWQQFNDPILNQFIESSLKSNLDLSIALSNLENAKGQLSKVQLSWIPFVDIYSGFTTNPAFGNAGTFYGLWPQYTLNIAQLIQQQKQAKYNLQMTEAMVEGMRLTVIGQTSSAYFTLIAQQEQLRLLNILESDIGKLVKVQQDELAVGLKEHIHISDALIDQKLVQSQINIAEHNILLSQNALQYLINQNPAQIKTKDNFAQLNFNKFKPGSLPATVLQNRPDLKIAEYSVKAAHAGVGVAYGALFPALQIDSFFGAGSTNGTLAAPDNYYPIQDDYMNWGINPSTFGQIEAQKGAYQAQVYRYIQTVRKILRDVDDSFSASNYYSKSYANTFAALQRLEYKYKLQQDLYDTGLTGLPQILTDKIRLDNLLLSANQSKLQQAIATVNLYQELAGGYKYDESATQTSKVE
jgi:outer membrane protein TolC